MIYHFPNLDTLHLAIINGVVPPEVSMKPAVAGEDEEGHVWLQPSVPLARKAQTGLRRLGVEVVKADGDLQGLEVTCWQQYLPVVRDPNAQAPSAQTPVLFELTDVTQLPDLVSEMLRLGNDRQTFRWLKDGKEDRVLLRVVGPPYYSLLRAIDRESQGTSPRAYVERVPRVWVELGHTQALAEFFNPPPGTLLLMRSPRAWEYLEEAPFQDIYDVLEFKMPGSAVAWQETEAKSRISVPLRLSAASTADPAELWVLRDDGADQLDTLVRDSEDSLIQRLSFAVGEHEGERTIVVRVRPSKQPPPVLVLKGQDYRSFSKLPNLFLPRGKALKPPLRRDIVRQMLASDPDQITWLVPHEDGTFTPESLPDAAFRPLHDWVDYVLDCESASLQAWIEAARFDFQSFICTEDKAPGAPKPPSRERKPKGAKEEPILAEEPPTPTPPPVKKGTRRRDLEEDFALLPQAKPSELQQRLTGLEKQFLDNTGPLDAPDRQGLWPEMAILNTALGHSADAAVCWLNSFWQAEAPPPEWGTLWLKAEKVALAEASPEEIDRLLGLPNPSGPDVRSLVACIVSCVVDGTARETLGPRLPRLQQYLEKHEGKIGVRAVWLSWVSLASLSAGDVLGLARARDRLLERLLGQGLNVEFDLPTFLRFAGQHAGDRLRVVRDQVQRLREMAHQWISFCYEKDAALDRKNALEPTRAYADLIFSFGLARLGEASASRALEAKAKEVLGERSPVHSFLLESFCYRIQQVLEGRPHVGPLPPHLLEYLADMAKQQGHDDKSRGQFLAYKVDRLRSQSRILEPQEKVEPYRRWHARDDLGKELVALTDLSDREELAQRLGKLLQTVKQGRPRLQVLATALELAPRITEAFTVDVLDRLGPALDALPAPQDPREVEDRATVLERALFVAAHFDRSEHVQALVARILQLIESQSASGSMQAIDTVAGQCFRGLRKVGLRDEVDRLLQRMADLVLQGQTLAVQRQRKPKEWPTALRTLLQVAAGWLYFGHIDKALPVLQEARLYLFDAPHEIIAPERTKLACVYAATLGQAPVELALPRLAELFQRIGVLADRFTTNDHYSRSQLEVVEAVVLAIVSDDFALTQGARRWLDEDEYLVRRRIHRDLRALMAQHGV